MITIFFCFFHLESLTYSSNSLLGKILKKIIFIFLLESSFPFILIERYFLKDKIGRNLCPVMVVVTPTFPLGSATLAFLPSSFVAPSLLTSFVALVFTSLFLSVVMVAIAPPTHPLLSQQKEDAKGAQVEQRQWPKAKGDRSKTKGNFIFQEMRDEKMY